MYPKSKCYSARIPIWFREFYCLLTLCSILFSGCNLSGNGKDYRHETSSDTAGFTFPFDLSRPDRTLKLPGKLEEISGLSVWSDSLLAVINDEKGNIYLYHLEQEDVVKKVDFGKNKDYEGIEVVGETVWVLRSDGKLTAVHNFNTPNQEEIKHETFLNEDCDAEGLAWDRAGNRLLVACKGKWKGLQSRPESRGVYAFALDQQKLEPRPAFIIPVNAGIAALRENDHDHEFEPSGIAIPPKERTLFVISSTGQRLLVYDMKNSLLHSEPLPKQLFPQPEGITFLPNGDLAISNEAANEQPANLLIFSRK